MIKLTNEELAKNVWNSIDFQNMQRLPYSRGFTYIMRVDAQIRKKSFGKRSVDDVVFALLDKKNKRQSFGLTEWLLLLEDELPDTATQEFKFMADGGLLIPLEDTLGPDYRLVRQDQEMLELGFDASSINNRVISGLRKGSRAAAAGLKDGDTILKNTFVWEVGNDFGKNMSILVRRPGEKEEGIIQVEYWPRSWAKVESYAFEAIR